MDSATINRWIKNLGTSYDALIENEVITNLPLVELYEDSKSLEVEPAFGVELSFWAETQRFEAVHIILGGEREDGLPIYEGELPLPYSATMTQSEARNALGEPMFTKTPLQLHGLDDIWGWDTYQVNIKLHPAAQVDLQYTEDMRIKRLIFSLFDRNI
jgi:hypothetical protein